MNITKSELEIIERYKEMNSAYDGTSPVDQKIGKIYTTMEFRSTPNTADEARDLCNDVLLYNRYVSKKNEAIAAEDVEAEKKYDDLLEQAEPQIKEASTQIVDKARDNIDTAKDCLDQSADTISNIKGTLTMESELIDMGMNFIVNLMG